MIQILITVTGMGSGLELGYTPSLAPVAEKGMGLSSVSGGVMAAATAGLTGTGWVTEIRTHQETTQLI